ncbi:hypothetical protein [Bacillus sp. OAE603]|uniref:hypothetical protein n=1 Tax=Gottfriedia sp. OAE603 TaxID=2663872 RepID=UPI001789D405
MLQGGNQIVFVFVSFICFVAIIFLLIIKSRKNDIRIENREIQLNHTDLTLEKIQLIWLTNIGDYRIKRADLERMCTNNTIIMLSGYSKKRSKTYLEEDIQFLSSLAPTYYLWSSEDYKGNYRDLNALLLDCKVTILENTNALFETENGTNFSIIGLDDVGTNRDHIDYALENINSENINILTSFTEVKNSLEKQYESIQVYLFERSQDHVNRNQKTIYLELNNEKGLLKQKTITFINFKVLL